MNQFTYRVSYLLQARRLWIKINHLWILTVPGCHSICWLCNTSVFYTWLCVTQPIGPFCFQSQVQLWKSLKYTRQSFVFVCVSVPHRWFLIIKLGTMTASDMIMHHVLITLTLTFIQGHTDLNHENNKCLISENVQANCPSSLLWRYSR